MIILDTTADEEENDATKKGQENGTEENQIGGWIGQEGKRRKSYSAAMIDGIKRNYRIYVGDSIVRKTDTRLSKGEEVVVCLPGACDRESRRDHGKRKWRVHTGTHRDEQRGQGRNNSDT